MSGWFRVALGKTSLTFQAVRRPKPTILRTTAINSPSQRTFRYQALSYVDEIRLLRISYNAHAPEPTYSFEHHSLTSPPPYTALSYVWGNLTPQKLIPCQPEGHLSITPNLHAFLETVPRMRYSTDKPIDLIWIDAVCIDQGDVEERASQVRQMGTIYQKANEVLIWLGPTSEDSGMVAGFITDLTHYFLGLDDSVLHTPDLLHKHPGLVSQYDPKWSALVRFIQRPWFKRAWVQQEVILASSVSMACGTDWISWDNLVVLSCIINEYLLCGTIFFQIGNRNYDVQECADLSHRFQLIVQMEVAKKEWQEGKKASILENVIELSLCDASDPRDKIYSFMGMSMTPVDDGFQLRNGWYEKIDYTSTVEEVYTSFAHSMLVQCQSNECLPLTGSLTRHTRTLLGTYQVQKNTSVCIRASGDPNCILVKGQHIDTVKSLCIPPPWFEPQKFVNLVNIDDGSAASMVEEWIEEVERLAKTLNPYFNGQPCLEACWRTLSANKYLNGTPLPSKWEMHEVTLLKREVLPKTNHSGDDDDLFGNAKFKAIADFEHNLILMRDYGFSITEGGYMGMFPMDTAIGDDLCIFHGHSLPFVLRRVSSDSGNEERYQRVGECYIHGIMNGELVREDLTREFLLA